VAILPLLSAQSPQLDSGHPLTLDALLDVLLRRQYAVASLWPRMAPLWLQLGQRVRVVGLAGGVRIASASCTDVDSAPR
jgi:predicted signal transduction protein with EAL and GGDEF domain